MKLDTLKQQVSVLRGEQTQDTAFGIEGKNMHLAIQAFYQYSDPLGSILREITSNAWDAHIEAGTDKKVIVEIDTDEKAIRILDFGIGLSEERVKNIYTKFFSSTKRASNDQIGAFGLGCKSPLSYTDMFQVTTKYGDAIREYVVHKADGIPSLVKLGQQPWEPRESWSRAQAQREITAGRPRYHWGARENGTEVVVPYQAKDEAHILDAARKQLCYFDNVVVMHPKIGAYNTEKIHQGKHLIYRQTSDYSYGIDRLHLCMGKVYYPLADLEAQVRNTNMADLHAYIDEAAHSVLGPNALADPFARSLAECTSTGYNSAIRNFIAAISALPMGLYFEIGELPILWHRENIEYTDAAWETILRRLFEAGMELRKLQIDQIGPISSLVQGLKLQLAGVGEDAQLYMSRQALKTTGTTVHLADLSAFVQYPKNGTPLGFIDLLYESHPSSELRAPGSKELARALTEDYEASRYYRMEPGEVRKPGLKDYMALKGRNYVLCPRRNSAELARNIGATTPEQAAVVDTYAGEFFALLERRIPEANATVIPEGFLSRPKAATQSEIPILWRRFSSDGNIQYHRDDLKSAMKGPRRGYWGLDQLPSLLVYGFHADRELLNAYARNNTSSLLRTRFAQGYKTEAYPPIMGLISKETAGFIDQVCPAIYITDFLQSRRGIANMVTRHLMALYRKKYPWMDRMLADHKRYSSTFYELRREGSISEEDFQRIHRVIGANPGRFYSQSHSMWPWVKKGLARRLYHWDELEELRWAHGFLGKFAPVLGSYWAERPSEDGAHSHYYRQILGAIQRHINPILYRKYHVKHIE